MLARKNRIPKTEFPSFKKKGIRFVSGLFTGTAYPSLVGAQISVVVSKKTAKGAVDRNRLRRRFYGAMEPFIKRFAHGSMVVFYPKIEALRAPAHQLQQEIEIVLIKTKTLS